MNGSQTKIDASRPIKLTPAKSWRTYLGGKLIDELHGAENPLDSHFPEEWMISVVSSRTIGREDDGLSKLDIPNADITLKEIIQENPSEFLGKKHVERFGDQTGVLVKLIDSAERLIVQVHPDKEKAQQFFGSKYGKTECWHFVGGRNMNGEPPHVYVGFKSGVTKQQWEALFYEQDIEGMLACLHKYYISPGDTFLIEAGVPHAIGPGCLLVEIQEPTDYTIRMERTSPSGLHIEDYLIHQGIGFEKMFDVFKYESFSWEETLKKWQTPPRLLTDWGGNRESELIGYMRTPYFRMTQVEVQQQMELYGNGVFSGLYLLSGSAIISTGDSRQEVKRGDQLFIPAQVGSCIITNNGTEPVKALRFFGPEV
ncbi:type I phosphomannose isomerase catalytic subunit [Neobacillus niacini]|uniref:type I phosphomannose isomerase catalytic subunit n=1 Tax=Neobacillus niacini TaxID=86668 RepID=UPI0021CB2178|nr:type I phosphomannose isomerase catalytic subunit [Neobacillus niacini]MCM3764170.1 class I mannose-6-phosphate isomerase [Neobacillus niacini]